jgi:hypothetical protein
MTRIVEYDNVESRIKIYFARVKNDLSNVESKHQTFDCFSLWDERSEWDRKSRNEAISAKLLQLSTKWLIRLTINDWIRVQRDYISVHWIVRIHDELWIRTSNEFWFFRREWFTETIDSQKASIDTKSSYHREENEKYLRFHQEKISTYSEYSKKIRWSKKNILIWIRRRRHCMIIHQKHQDRTIVQKTES